MYDYLQPRFFLVCCFLSLGFLLMTVPVVHAEQEQPRVLVFSKTTGFRHDSIEAGKRALLELGEAQGFSVDISENATLFVPEVLASYHALIFLNTTGDLFTDAQKRAFQGYIRAGGGFVGIHSASDTEKSWPWYNKLVGAIFANHPENQYADVVIVDYDHPSTVFFKTELNSDRWRRYDEWYNFRNMNPDVTVLAKVDEKTYTGGRHGDDHPVLWYHNYDGGRAFYTAGGHTQESFQEPLFLRHLLGGIRYAMGVEAHERSQSE